MVLRSPKPRFSEHIDQPLISFGGSVKALSRDGDVVETFRASKILAFRGLARQPVEVAEAGDIVAIAGMSKATVSDTLCDPSVLTWPGGGHWIYLLSNALHPGWP